MKRTIKIKLNLDAAESMQLHDLMTQSSSLFNLYVDWAFKQSTFSKMKAHVELYDKLRKQFPQLPSAMIQTTRDVALEAVKATKLKYRPAAHASQSIRYDVRTFSLRGQQLTLSTHQGRFRTILQFSDWSRDVLSNWKAKAVQLCFDSRKNCFYAHIVCESLQEPAVKQSGETIGLDRGLVNIVATSRGEIYDSKLIRENQRKHLYLRRKLQAKGTRSAKRLLRSLSGKEKRFSREQNHIITKRLAADATVRAYVLEDLTGIRRQRSKGRKLNKLLSSWSFSQFEQFLAYKCEAAGIGIEFVNARFTSQRCSSCGVIDKNSRMRGRFLCASCGFKCHADINAAINIRDRLSRQPSARSNGTQGAVNRPDGRTHVSQWDVDSCQGHSLVL